MRRGGGTALPGLVAERLDPNVVRRLARQLAKGSILITGTNGKTTTSRMLASMLSAERSKFLHNREGSNLMRGIASALIEASTPFGRMPEGAQTLGLFETDEATLPRAAADLQPRSITFTNLFRDQLDRYGEVDSVFRFWKAALDACPESTTIVLNADDPSVSDLADEWRGPVAWFGLEAPEFAVSTGGAFDARWCRACGGRYEYAPRYFAHVGIWRCARCGRSRTPAPDTVGRDVHLRLISSTFQVDGLGSLSMPLTGLYNVYNALGAIATARTIGLSEEAIVAGLSNVLPAFGRQEVVALQGRNLHLVLVKNPAGANQTLQLLGSVAQSGEIGTLYVAVLLNDRFADGQDVSWIWDVDFEPLAQFVHASWAGGTRAADIALRLKYAGWPPVAAATTEPGALLESIVRETLPDDHVFVVPTYTAMLDLRAELARRGAVGSRFNN